MNFVYQYLPEEIVSAIGWTIFHSIWQGALIAVLLGVSLYLSNKKSAKLRYAISVSALTLFVMVAVITFSIKYEPAVTNISLNKINPVSGTLVSSAYFENPVSQIVDTPGILESLQNYFRQQLPLFVFAWFVGLMIFSLRFMGSVLHLQRIRTHGLKELDVEWFYRSRQLTQKLGIKKFVSVYESARVKIPIALGYLKPIILLPAGMISGLPYSQVEALLAHELAHIKRYDFLVNLIQSFVETIFFYHPAVWWISNQIREERENCCDDITMNIYGDTLAFSKALYNLQHIKENHPELALAASGNENQLLRRIKRMNGEKSKFAYGGRFAALMFLFIVVTAMMLFTSTDASTKIDDINKAGFVNPLLLGDESSSAKYPAKLFSINGGDTTSVKKGKRTIKFNDDVAGEEKRFKAKLNNGKLEKLYIDGEEVPADELDKYENKVTKQADEYDAAMKEYRESMREFKDNMKLHKEKMSELRKKLSHLNVRHFNYDFPIPTFDSEEFKELMKNVRENVNKHFANRSFTIPEIHIPPIVIPPIPPINFDCEDDWDNNSADKEEFKKSMNEWKKEFKENMKEFSQNMKENNWDLGKMAAEINKSVNSKEFKESMNKLKANMGKLKADMKILKEYLHDLKDELVNDNLIEEDDDLDGFCLSTKEMKVNGKIVSEDLHQKYLALYKKHYGKDLREDQKFNIND